MRRRNVLQQRFEDRDDIRPAFFQLPRCCARPAAGVENGEIERLIIRAELDEQIEDFVQNLVGPGVWPIDFVDDDDRPQLVLERLFEHEPRLRHRAFGRIDEEENPVGHAENAFDLATEIGVAGGVDQVDLGGLPVRPGVIDGDILGQDGDAAFAFEGIGIEEGILLHLAVAEIAALAKQSIDEGRFAVVDVGDDGDISDVVTHLIHCMAL